MTTAFVLSGGGSLGAVQVGMLAALAERDVRPDLLVGTSVGALNAAYIAAHGFDTDTVDRLATVWRRLRRADVFPIDPLRHALAIAGRRTSLCSMRPLQRVVETNLPLRNLEDALIPLHVVATDVMSGEEVMLSTGDAASAVLASAAIPAVFPHVEREGHVLMDGGVANNTAVSQAVALGAERIVVLPAGFACALTTAPATPIAAAMHALTLLIEQRLIVEVGRLTDHAEIIVLPPLCPLSVSAVNFAMTDELMARARRATGTWLDTGRYHLPHPERFLSLHGHTWSQGCPHEHADGEPVPASIAQEIA
jgi:NTE family protein